MEKQLMFQAFMERDPAYEGRFFAAVRTTGIFCRPTCTARKPKKENVEFFSTAGEALLAGYRPCKICRPLEAGGSAPPDIRNLLARLEENPGENIRDRDLRDSGLDPAAVRRWFRKLYGMTFHGFQRALRLGEAFGRIRHGESVTESALNSGFESISAFNDAFKKRFGNPPSETKAETLITVTRISTPIGFMLAAAVKEGICLLEFADRRALEKELQDLKRLLNAETLPGLSPWFRPLSEQLGEYFQGRRRSFDIPLVTPGSDFQKSVWKVLRTIPYGKTSSYKDQALSLGNPKALRAVARANGQNRIAVLIPCHRVIGEDGTLVGYGGGLWRKRWLLDLEAGRLHP